MARSFGSKKNMKKLAALLCAACLALPVAGTHAATGYDVLKLPAEASPLAPQALVYSLTRIGDRVFATGIRGHILYSDDFGQSWTQAQSVPVRSSLLDAAFPTPEQGWVAGHDGVVLHTGDGGKTWVKQLDGVQLAQIGLDYYRRKQEQEPDNERYAFLVDEMTLATEQAADRPFFKVVMRDAKNGFVAGAYGLLFRTDDGGDSWYPVMELLDLDQFVHLFDYAVLPPAPAAGDVAAAGAAEPQMFMSGEMGTLLTRDAATGHWRRLEFPYDGSMFTLLATQGDALVTGGLRGLVFRSADRGLSWQEANKPQTGSIVAGTVLSDGRVVIATQEGTLLLSTDEGANFALLSVDNHQPISDLLEGRPGELILSGTFGVRVQRLPDAAAVTQQP
jgi:photosystem II stability/assembly factor-like uncharacterized protein